MLFTIERWGKKQTSCIDAILQFGIERSFGLHFLDFTGYTRHEGAHGKWILVTV
ncbi:hypothetical protein BDZ91DRAFT_751899 [Kalaharituber pfeilii]|nr:hypothetical protein BDZ91DRAFT_751899 [Kalaharituber pfeilii]